MSPAAGDALAATVAADRQRELSWRYKVAPAQWYGRTVAEVTGEAPLLSTLATPAVALDLAAANYNISEMAAWCASAGVSLAPHGKTTMTPGLWRMQLAAGAWAITIANEPQLRAARGLGVSRIVLANMVLGAETLGWLSAELDRDESFEFYCWVDSVQAVELMDAALRAAGGRRRVRVLVELGESGARTGARSASDALAVAKAVVASPRLELAGVAGYEALVAQGVGPHDIRAVEEFLERMLDAHRAFEELYEVDDVILSAGGSRFFDLVATVLGRVNEQNGGRKARIVLRSGSYVTHDDGLYRRTTPKVRGIGPEFVAAIHVWARVISMPEPGIAYLDAGRRDLPFDAGLPEVQQLCRTGAAGEVERIRLADHEVVALNDQHAHVTVPLSSPLALGDIVRLGISHPCTVFDKWSLIPVIDDATAPAPRIVDMFRTYF